MRRISFKSAFMALATAISVMSCSTGSREADGRWSAEYARQWYEDMEWPVGCDYIPAYAGNQLQMWGAGTWDPEAIDRELGWAEDLGFNTVRIFLHHKLWEDDRDGFFSRIDEFLEIADSHDISSLVTLFTNGGSEERFIGEDISPVKGIHNSIWAQTPGKTIINDPSRWSLVERYEKDVLKTFGKDDRIIAWCLYNEPENVPECNTLPLMKKVFEWAFEIRPSQPVTATVITNPFTRKVKYYERFPIITYACEHSDIISYHCYDSTEEHEAFLKMLEPFGRPVFCTEYMARTRGCTLQSTLPLLKGHKVAAYNFGLVNGATQCHYEWNTVEDGVKVPFEQEPELWFHDLLNPDGSARYPEEIEWLDDFLKD
ncbi:MAG: hypothetical protein MJY50_06895 [Bacteroidales bacterium]|nr:hypothetical protein [Bacteroidales bacterium]